MSALVDRLTRLRWMAVPIVAYLVITLGLPIANGAASRGEFVRHATYVVAGCLAVVALALIGGTIVELVRSVANKRRPPRVGEQA